MSNCPICNSGNINQNLGISISAPYVTVQLGFTDIPMATMTDYSMCKDCELVFQTNMQTDAWYEWYYASGAYRGTLGITQEVMDADEKQRADDLLRYLVKWNVHPTSHLDIGASRGYFLENTQRAFGCDIEGVEPNTRYKIMEYQDAKNIDLVSAIHVLEHLTHPKAELEKYASMTSRYLLIEVPGKNCKGGPLRFAHLYYFPVTVLQTIIHDLGFRCIDVETEPNTRILAERIS